MTLKDIPVKKDWEEMHQYYEDFIKVPFETDGNDRIKKIWMKESNTKKRDLWIDVFIYDFISEKLSVLAV